MDKLGMGNGIQNSEHYWQRASSLIPCGTQCLSKGPTQFIDGYAPKYLASGNGCVVTDVDGNRLIDYGMGLGAVSLGYQYPSVNSAIINQLNEAITLTLMHPLEVEVSELIREVVPCAESVRFGKNGSDVTSAAVRLARAYTRKDIILCGGYHGWHDWYVITTERSVGIPPVLEGLTKKFTYNDIDSLKILMNKYKGRVAAVIMEPVGVIHPQPHFLADVKQLAHDNGALLIFDEVLTGFRIALGGAQQHYGVTPDLATFGKAVANGMPLSVLAGKAEIMSELENVFFSFTFGGEMLSLAAAKATIEEMKAHHTIDHVNAMGKRLMEQGNTIIEQYGLSERISIQGPHAKTLFVYSEAPDTLLIKSFLQQEMMRRGILFTSYNYVSYSHKEEQIQYTLDALNDALSELSKAMKQNNLVERLEGKAVAPVFRKA